ncbi:helix-turn-helix domain-containing protein [Microbacterium esteraromaticum]|uniref:helix-turn-helix domain-containing protein n=1 Tax=Microbacterium esteraromaticum TaxID=57043 RepID=UPI0015F6CFE6|nr:helix-turn-helix domain-containing protein [Microbacterium esteraromaticum]
MSIESIAIALHHSRATGAAKLVLVGIANHDGDGGAWPSVATLSRYAGVTPRGAQKAVQKLEQLHEIRRHVQRGGDAFTADPQRPNLYEFLLTCPPDCDRSSKHRTRNSGIQTELSTGVNPSSPGEPQFVGRANPSSPKPSTNHPSTTEKKSHVGERARAACGHELIDERHCDRGCPAPRVIGAAA